MTITLSDTTPPTVTAFTVPATATTTHRAHLAFTATDNVAVTGYLVNESATTPSAAPLAGRNGPDFVTFTTAGTKTLYAWAKDAAGNVSASKSAAVTITLSDTFTIWPSTATPAVVADPETGTGELGVKFTADSSGYITGIRFYKASTNTGTHVGNLWTSTGSLLATATFTNETATAGKGQLSPPRWPSQPTPSTSPRTSHPTSGTTAIDEQIFRRQGVTTAPLTLPDGRGRGPTASTATAPPASSRTPAGNASNYWVDVVFTTTLIVDTTAPTVTAFTIPATATSLTVPITTLPPRTTLPSPATWSTNPQRLPRRLLLAGRQRPRPRTPSPRRAARRSTPGRKMPPGTCPRARVPR